MEWLIKKLTTYDPAAADNKEIAAFMADALETDDVAHIAKSLSMIARAKGMASLENTASLLKFTVKPCQAAGPDETKI